MELEIRLMTDTRHARACHEHLMRHFSESGADGDIVFHPLLNSWQKRDLKHYVDKWDLSWSKPVTELGWERAWFMFAEDGRAMGHVFLRSLQLEASLHRSFLGIGMERSVRGQGWGRKLMEVAIGWAREQPSLEYIDLYVFGHNTKARALYTSLGFIERGINHDSFRVVGQQIDDIHMVMKLTKG